MSVRINTKPVADHYASRGQKIIEYSFRLESGETVGGLISFHETERGPVIDLYRHDEGIEIRVGSAS